GRRVRAYGVGKLAGGGRLVDEQVSETELGHDVYGLGGAEVGRVLVEPEGDDARQDRDWKGDDRDRDQRQPVAPLHPPAGQTDEDRDAERQRHHPDLIEEVTAHTRPSSLYEWTRTSKTPPARQAEFLVTGVCQVVTSADSLCIERHFGTALPSRAGGAGAQDHETPVEQIDRREAAALDDSQQCGARWPGRAAGTYTAIGSGDSEDGVPSETTAAESYVASSISPRIGRAWLPSTSFRYETSTALAATGRRSVRTS